MTWPAHGTSLMDSAAQDPPNGRTCSEPIPGERGAQRIAGRGPKSGTVTLISGLGFRSSGTSAARAAAVASMAGTDLQRAWEFPMKIGSHPCGLNGGGHMRKASGRPVGHPAENGSTCAQFPRKSTSLRATAEPAEDAR